MIIEADSLVDLLIEEIDSDRVIEADSLLSDWLDDEINIERVFEADSLSIRLYYTHVTELVSFMPL